MSGSRLNLGVSPKGSEEKKKKIRGGGDPVTSIVLVEEDMKT